MKRKGKHNTLQRSLKSGKYKPLRLIIPAVETIEIHTKAIKRIKLSNGYIDMHFTSIDSPVGSNNKLLLRFKK